MIAPLLAASAFQYVFGILLFLTSTFLILLVMVQRGRGGGLAGAFGGMGGQSAFGTKAGDVFTRVTIAVAAVWILLCVGTIVVLNRQGSSPLGERTITGPSLRATDEDGSTTTDGDGASGDGASGGGGSDDGATGSGGAGSGSSADGDSGGGAGESGDGGSGDGESDSDQ